LCVIESLAFYLELIAAENDKSRLHLRQIRTMVRQPTAFCSMPRLRNRKAPRAWKKKTREIDALSSPYRAEQRRKTSRQAGSTAVPVPAAMGK
jgi:hypothetical protein